MAFLRLCTQLQKTPRYPAKSLTVRSGARVSRHPNANPIPYKDRQRYDAARGDLRVHAGRARPGF
jgi:hypothetical protein